MCFTVITITRSLPLSTETETAPVIVDIATTVGALHNPRV